MKKIFHQSERHSGVWKEFYVDEDEPTEKGSTSTRIVALLFYRSWNFIWPEEDGRWGETIIVLIRDTATHKSRMEKIEKEFAHFASDVWSWSFQQIHMPTATTWWEAKKGWKLDLTFSCVFVCMVWAGAAVFKIDSELFTEKKLKKIRNFNSIIEWKASKISFDPLPSAPTWFRHWIFSFFAQHPHLHIWNIEWNKSIKSEQPNSIYNAEGKWICRDLNYPRLGSHVYSMFIIQFQLLYEKREKKKMKNLKQ